MPRRLPLPRTNEDVVALAGQHHNNIVQRLEDAEQLVATPPLMIADNGKTKVISLIPQPQPFVLVKLIADRADGGEYEGLIGHGRMTSTAGNLVMPEGYTFPAGAPCIVYNPPETGTPHHRIDVNDEQQRYRLGKVTGVVTDEGSDKGKRIVELDSGLPVVEFLVVDHIYPCTMIATGHVGDEDEDTTIVRLLYPSASANHRINFDVGNTIAFIRIPTTEFGPDGIALQPDIGGVDFTWTQAAGAPQNINGMAGIEWSNRQTVDGVERDDFDIEAGNGGDLGVGPENTVCTDNPLFALLGWNGVDVDYFIPGVGLSGIVGGIRKFVFNTDHSSGDDEVTCPAKVVFTLDNTAAKTTKITAEARVKFVEKTVMTGITINSITINGDCTVTLDWDPVTEVIKVLDC